MLQHPGHRQLSFGTIPLGPNAVRYHEWHLSALRAGGLPDRTAALAGDLIHLYVDAFAYEECLGMPAPDGRGIGRLGRARCATTSPRSRPIVFRTSPSWRTRSPAGSRDERFEFGLEILIGGLAAQAGR